MKRILFLTIGLALTLMQFSCDFDFDDGIGPCVRGNGNNVSRELNLPNFTGVDLDISAEVIITQGDSFKVTVEGESNIIAELETDVRNGIWEIDFDRCVRDQDELTIFITMPRVRSLSISGSGIITSTNIMEVDDIDLNISGSGKIDVGLDADDISSRISGSGRVVLEGEANSVEHTVSGSGDLFAFLLQTRDADIRVSGSGNSEVKVSENLNVRISGSGDVYYRGKPQVEVSISGSGKLVNAN
ncbi:head GIN domain-containing protein [Haliscomenobacter sp.]|uniref:head GIN domain-containing protein n=1 Tax=Haliscomenobacter sp. TaxID=2717303 RepID=UPI003593EB95